ncbi:hypothetical protein SCACP_38280 [Sporomusa carbonis]|uniref:carbohydrate-binding protein n=1 Tax=Sporomusa carbonis TaxID=3076075 RepID=UPI003A5FB84F
MAKYHANGVFIYPAVPPAQSISRIIYNGLLPKSGATEVYAHVGLGRSWESIRDYKMTKTAHGFEASIPIPPNADILHVCFKDAANNWDNNAGANYSFIVGPPNDNYSLEIADEISIWDDIIDRCRSNLSTCKTTICRLFKSSV